jgi:putative hydrolase of the HAD superfamily
MTRQTSHPGAPHSGRSYEAGEERPRAVFFDVGWTLIHPRQSLWETLARVGRAAGAHVAAADCEARLHALWRQAQAHAAAAFRADAAFSDSDEEFSALFRHLALAAFAGAGLAGEVEPLVERFVDALGDRNAWQVYPEVPEVLRALRGDGYVLGVVSNASSDLADFLAHLGVGAFFDFVVASAAEGAKKPDRRIFGRALDLAGTPPAQTLHVGDLALEDVVGARNAGLRAVLIHRGAQSLFPSFPPDVPEAAAGAPVVRDLRELRALLGAAAPRGDGAGLKRS